MRVQHPALDAALAKRRRIWGAENEFRLKVMRAEMTTESKRWAAGLRQRAERMRDRAAIGTGDGAYQRFRPRPDQD